MDVYKLDHILCLNAKLNGEFFCNGFQAPIVQLDRMSAYGADGRRFESCMGCFSSEAYGLFDTGAKILLTGLEPAIFALGGRRLIH